MSNRYEATLPNTTLRLVAWCRGLSRAALRRYKRPLLIIGAATVTLVAGVSATHAPDTPAPSSLAPPTAALAALAPDERPVR